MFKNSIDGLDFTANRFLPNNCHLLIDSIENRQSNLPPDESKYLGVMSRRRQKEFIGGRNIARSAMSSLNSENVPLSITRDEAGCPNWPAGMVGSISHKVNIVGAFVGYKKFYRSLGFDIEIVEPLDPNTWRYFAADEEMNSACIVNLEKTIYANMLFSIKESIFKCLYPIYRDNAPKLISLKPEIKLGKDGYTADYLYLKTKCFTFVYSNKDIIISCTLATEIG